MNKNFDDDKHITISYEFLKILCWITKHATHALRHMIREALENSNKQNAERPSSESAHGDILDFFIVLDSIITEENARLLKRKTQTRQLQPTLNHIDTTLCNADVLRASLKKATALAEKGLQEEAKALLMQEILRNWKPAGKKSVN